MTTVSAAPPAVGGLLRRWAAVPFYPFLLAAYPVLLLLADNLEEGIALSSVLLPLAAALAVTAMGYLLLWSAWRSRLRAAVVITAVVVPCLVFRPLVDAVGSLWPESSDVRSQLVVLLAWGVIVLLTTALASRSVGLLPRLTETLNAAAIVLVVLVVVPIARFALWPAESVVAQSPRSPSVATAHSGARRDIYHLVFDRYGSESSLRSGYGIDNREFIDWLETNGFQVVPDARSNYWRTLPALSSMFRMSLLDDLAAEMGPRNPNPQPLHWLLRNNPAAATLQELGYTYVHLGSWYGEFTQSDTADLVHAPDYQVDFGSIVLESTALPFIERLWAIATSSERGESLWPRAQATLDQLRTVESMAEVEGPKLVYAHFLVPHEPYVFLEDGTIDPQHATFETQLRFTNRQIRRLVEPLLAKPEDERPIVLLQADEGPYPPRYKGDGTAFDWTTATDEELLTKFGVLSAWYLPGPEGATPVPDGISLVNTYPELLRRYHGLNLARSPDRTNGSRGGRLYDHIDLTGRLNDAFRQSTTEGLNVDSEPLPVQSRSEHQP